MNNNILLIYGGNSVEREISIITALQIYKQYSGKYNLILCYLNKGNFYSFDALENIQTYSKKISKKPIKFTANKNYVIIKNKKVFFEAVWIVSHGKECEDGTITNYFKTLNIPVIAENPTWAAIGQDKSLSKSLTKAYTLPFLKINKDMLNNNMNTIVKKAKEYTYPVIIKPNSLGSSVGIKVVNNPSELIDRINELLNLDENLIMEKCLEQFIELNIALLKYKNDFIISEIEKVSDSKVLSYDDKYINETKSMSNQKKELPALIDESLKEKIIKTAKTIYTDLNASLIVRIDFLYDNKNNKLIFNEINNIPGALSYYLFKSKDVSINELIDMCIDEGLASIERQSQIIKTYDNNILNSSTINTEKFSK